MGFRCKERQMKALFVLPLAAAGLLLTAGVACGQGAGMGAQPTGRAALEQNANESVQDITDMWYGDLGQPAKTSSHAFTNISYGGTPDVRGEAGAPGVPPCASGSQCNIFRGR
jgi:hypothetical protein